MQNPNTKRIARNTLMLYIRMFATMIITLYTSRVVLNTLGVEDYGIYNVVGGFITIFAFISSSLSTATQRFLNYELGKQQHNEVIKVFSMSINIHFLLAMIILILAETIGLWFVNTQLTIPADRLTAANWVYQSSVLAFMIMITTIPYDALVIAHEKMDVYAWVSIVEVSLKLLIVFMLQWFGYDKLKLYAVLVFLVALIIRLIYVLYCRLNFSESKYVIFWDLSLFKSIFNFAGWNLMGNIAATLYGQGVNILLNIFFGPVVNAARAIAYQVQGAVRGFVHNFQTALRPQIIKSYASGDFEYMHLLINQGAKYSYYLIFALSLPIILETRIILRLWLKIVPEYSVIFTQLVIINVLIDSISGPLMTAAQASGRIKVYQSVVGGLLLLILPVSYIFLKLGYEPQVTLYVSITISFVALFARLKIISPLVRLPLMDFIKNVLVRCLGVTLVAVIIPFIIKYSVQPGIKRLVLISTMVVISVLISIYFVGLTRIEKSFVRQKLVQLIKIS